MDLKVISDMVTDKLLAALRLERIDIGLPALTADEEQDQRLHDDEGVSTPFPATITFVHEDGSYDLLYDDGDTATRAPRAAVWQ